MNSLLVMGLTILICGLSFFKPIVGVFVLVATSWLGAIIPSEGVFTLNRVLGIIVLAGILLPQLIKRGKSPIGKFSTLEMLFAIYFMVIFLSSFYSFSNSSARELLLDVVTGFLLYFLIKMTVVSKTHLENFVKMLVVISLVVATYSFYAAQNADPLSKRIYGEFQVNLAGTICYVGIVCALWLSVAKKLPTLVAGIISMVLISVIFLSGTRSGLIALLSLAILFFLRILLTSAKRGRIITILALFAIGFFVSVKMVQSAFPLAVERVFSLTSFSISNPASTDRLRVDLINAAWLMFLDHPTLGIGFGNFNLNYGSYSQIFMNKQLMVHNIFMGALAETGILGFISLMSIYIYIIYSALRALYLQKSDPGIFDQWFPLMLFVGVNIVLAFLLYGTFDRLMFTIFAINMITLRNQQKNFSQQHQEIGD